MPASLLYQTSVPNPCAKPSRSRRPDQVASSSGLGALFQTSVFPSRVGWYSPVALARSTTATIELINTSNTNLQPTSGGICLNKSLAQWLKFFPRDPSIFIGFPDSAFRRECQDADP